jgi:hypothetical protein
MAVTQADRDAAHQHAMGVCSGTGTGLAQAFAAHREAAMERCAEIADSYVKDDDGFSEAWDWGYDAAAGAIAGHIRKAAQGDEG